MAAICKLHHYLKALLAKCKMARQTKTTMHCDTSKLDQKLLGFWCAARDIYNAAKKSPSEEVLSLESVKITSFLVVHSFRFAEPGFMLAANDNLLPAVALMRIAIESQARANHLISFNGQQREDKAAELFQLSEFSGKRFANLIRRSIRSAANIQNCAPEMREMITQSVAEPVAQSESLRKERVSLEGKWRYGAVIEKQFFGDQKRNLRTPFQQIQQTLDIVYNLGSFCLHPDLMSLRTEKMLSANEIMDYAVAVAVCVVHCYLVAIGRQNDPQFNQLVTEYGDYVRTKVKEKQDSLTSQGEE